MGLRVWLALTFACYVVAYETRGNSPADVLSLPPDALVGLKSRACDGVLPASGDELVLVTAGSASKGSVLLSLGAEDIYWVGENKRSQSVQKAAGKVKELTRVLKKVPDVWTRNRLLLGLVLAREAQEDASIRQAVNGIQTRRFAAGRIGEVLRTGGRGLASYSLSDGQQWCGDSESWAGIEEKVEALKETQFGASHLGELARVWEWIDAVAYTIVDGRKKAKKAGAKHELVKAFSQNRASSTAWFHPALPFICPAGHGGKRGGVGPNAAIMLQENGSVDVVALKNIDAGSPLYASDRIATSQSAIACEGRFTDGNPYAIMPLTTAGFKDFVEADKFRNLGISSFHSAIGSDKSSASDPLLEWRRDFSFGPDGRPSAKLQKYLRTVLAQQCDEPQLEAVRRGDAASPSNELATTKFIKHIASIKLDALGRNDELAAGPIGGDDGQLTAPEQSLARALLLEQRHIAERAIATAQSAWLSYAQSLVEWPDLK